MDQAAVVDVYRSVSVGNVHGIDVMSAALWHTSPYHTEKLVHALHPHLEQVGQLVVRFVPCVSSAVFYSLSFVLFRFRFLFPENLSK
jgi:hypothetical protein